MTFETASSISPVDDEQLCLRARLRNSYDVVPGPDTNKGDIPGESLTCRLSDECRFKRVNEFAYGRHIEFQLDRCVDQLGKTPRTYLSLRPE